MTDPRPLRADARRNRDAIIAAAREAFDRGDAELRFDDFAALAGVGVGTLYRHFPTREALAEAVYHDEVVALGELARRLLAEQPPREALAAFLHGFVAWLAEREGLALALTGFIRGRPEVQVAGGRALAEAVVELVDAARAEGATGLTVGAVMMALHGIGSTYGAPGWRADADALVGLVVAGSLSGRS